MTYEMETVELVARPTAVVRALVPAEGVAEFLGGAFAELMEVLAAQALAPVGMPFGCYLPTEDGLRVEAGFPASGRVEPTGRVEPSELPVGPALVVHYRGPYEGVPEAYHAGEQWLRENGWEATGPPWESYLDAPHVPAPRTDVYLPCRPR